MQRISNSFFKGRSTVDITQDLLGKKLVYLTKQGTISGYIVEAESYLGVQDSAAHAYRGRRSAFNEPLYAAPGAIYIYQRRQHFLFDVVTQEVGEPQGILVRALQPAAGKQLMQKNRPGKSDIDLTNGPAKLMQALGIQDKDRNFKLIADCSDLTIDLQTAKTPEKIKTSARIGVNQKGNSALAKLRFFVAGNPFVSGLPKSQWDLENFGWQKDN